jgi:hypothetical protein
VLNTTGSIPSSVSAMSLEQQQQPSSLPHQQQQQPSVFNLNKNQPPQGASVPAAAAQQQPFKFASAIPVGSTSTLQQTPFAFSKLSPQVAQPVLIFSV